MYQTWILRNKVLYDRGEVISSCSAQVNQLASKHLQSQSHLNKQDLSKVILWKATPSGWIKANVDVAMHDGFSVQAGFFGDEFSNGVHACSRKDICSFPLISEAKAMLLAIKEAHSMGFQNMIFEGDSLIVCSALSLVFFPAGLDH